MIVQVHNIHIEHEQIPLKKPSLLHTKIQGMKIRKVGGILLLRGIKNDSLLRIFIYTDKLHIHFGIGISGMKIPEEADVPVMRQPEHVIDDHRVTLIEIA